MPLKGCLARALDADDTPTDGRKVLSVFEGVSLRKDSGKDSRKGSVEELSKNQNE